MINSRPPWKVVMGQPRLFLYPACGDVKLPQENRGILGARKRQVLRANAEQYYEHLYRFSTFISDFCSETVAAALHFARLTTMKPAGKAVLHTNLPRHRLQPIPASTGRTWSFAAGDWSTGLNTAAGTVGRRTAARKIRMTRSAAGQRQSVAATRRSEP